MNASRVKSSLLAAALLAILTILSGQTIAQEGTEDPARYPDSWYRIVLDANGRYTSGDGDGYEAGTWYYYPQTLWYRQWFYNQPFDATGKGHFQYEAFVRPIDATKPTTVEINVNWTTEQWSWLKAKQPPLPKDAPTEREETQYMLGRGLYRIDSQSIKPQTQSFTFTIDQYSPEWVSIDIRGKNAYVYGGVIRDNNPQQGDEKTSEMDFGDAPDTYKTLVGSDGARHTIVAGICLGRGVDAEPDGRPGPAANGDDLNRTNDEDGVMFPSTLSSGAPATIEVTASTRGYLNAWIDFNRDGSFAGKGEQVFADQLLAPGLNRLSFNVPQTATKGATFARFRFSTRGLLSYCGPAADGEVEDYRVTIAERLQPQINSGKGGLKWSQAAQQFDPATPFILNGWGEPSNLHLRQIVADDWRCEDERPITGFQWCGSFEGWPEAALPRQKPLAFHIALWTDRAAQAGDSKASGHPDTLVWETFATHWTWSIAGSYSDPRRIGNDTCFQFTSLLSQDEWFYPPLSTEDGRIVPTVYWLSIAAFYDPNGPVPEHPWGWATRPQFFNAGAVRIAGVEPVDPRSVSWPPTLASRWQSGTAVEFPKGTAWDLTFELLTNQAAYGRDPELAPVYRFWSDTLGGHFYTISETEKDKLVRDFAHVWKFEGVAFYAYPPDRAPVGSKPVYRFWSDSLGRHFYSIRESEKQKLVDQFTQVWTFEGVAWYAFD